MASTGMMSLVDDIGCNDRIPLVDTDKSGWYLPNVAAAIAGILQDMNTILKSDDPLNVTTDHLIEIS